MNKKYLLIVLLSSISFSKLCGQTYNKMVNDSIIIELFNSLENQNLNSKGKIEVMNIGRQIIEWKADRIKFYTLDTNENEENYIFRRLVKFISRTDIAFMKEQLNELSNLNNWEPSIFNRKSLAKHRASNELISNKEKYYEFSVPLFTEDRQKCILLHMQYDPAGVGYSEDLYIKLQNNEWKQVVTIYLISS